MSGHDLSLPYEPERKSFFSPMVQRIKDNVWKVVAGGIAVLIAAGHGGTANHANLWMSPGVVGTCARVSIAEDYDSAKACRSIQDAVKAAHKGDTIRMKGGVYPPQMVLNSTPIGSGDQQVLVRPSEGEDVQIGNGTAMAAVGNLGNPSGLACKSGSDTSYFWDLCIQNTTSDIEFRDLHFWREETLGAGPNNTPTNSPSGSDSGRGAIAIANELDGHIPGVDNITLTRLLDATSVRIDGLVSDIDIIGGVYGGIDANNPHANGATTALNISSGPTHADLPTDILADGVIFQNDVSDEPGDHVECILANGVDGFTMRHSIIRECGRSGFVTGDINVNRDLGATDNIVFENNFWASTKPAGFFAIVISTNMIHAELIHNSWPDDAVDFNDNCTALGVYHGCADWIVRGNYGGKPPNCMATRDVDWQYNVLKGGACRDSDVAVSTLDYVDSGPAIGQSDMHLTSGANAIGMVPDGCPVNDIDGDPRPIPCAAGADEP